MRAGYFLGAGFSRAIHQSMPLMSQFPDAIKSTDPDLWSEIEARCKFSENIELCMDYLSQSQPWLDRSENSFNQGLYFKIVDWLTDYIDQKERETFEHYSPFLAQDRQKALTGDPRITQWPFQLVLHWLRSQSIVVTLNYDTCVERLVNYRVGHEPFTGRAYSRCYPVVIPPLASLDGISRTAEGSDDASLRLDLVKLHGSINWVFDSGGNEFDVVNSPYDASLSSIKERTSDQKTRKRAQKALIAGRKPLVVPPTFQKLQYFGNGSMRYLWEFASKELSGCDIIYFLGYSLPETDLTIRHMLNSSAIREGTKIALVNRDSNSLEHYKKMLPKGEFNHEFHSFGKEAIKNLAESLSGVGAKSA